MAAGKHRKRGGGVAQPERDRDVWDPRDTPEKDRVIAVQGKVRAPRDLQTLRITGGEALGRSIRSPTVHIRPMMSMVRESLFSMLSLADIFTEGHSILDLFAGSGVIGLESLSRGMGQSVFVDLSGSCVKTIQYNCEEMGFSGKGRAIKARAEHVLDTPKAFNITKPFSLVTMSPPYEEVSYPMLLKSVILSDAVGQDTVVVVEYPREIGLLPPVLTGPHPEGGGAAGGSLSGEGWKMPGSAASLEPKRLQGVRNRQFGRTWLAIYVCDPSGKLGLQPKPEEFTSQR